MRGENLQNGHEGFRGDFDWLLTKGNGREEVGFVGGDSVTLRVIDAIRRAKDPAHAAAILSPDEVDRALDAIADAAQERDEYDGGAF